jgi:6-pyruvoyltetrahydropterin/6-carboxytetrahydropterin synthase
MSASLTRVVRFRAAHHFWMPEWSAERNRSVFGAYTEPHQHEYTCRVTVAGPLDPRTGMVVELGFLDRVLDEEVLTPLAGKDLNRDVPAFASGASQPTCEALAAHLYGRIAARLPAGTSLERIRVEEDPTLYAECTGP